MKKKLIFITQALWIGGIETALINLLRALDGEKYEISCLILRKETQLAHRLPENCRLLTVDRAEAGWYWLRNLAEAPTQPSRLHRIFSWLLPLVRWADDRVFLRYLRRKLAGERYDTAVIYSDGAALGAKAVRAKRMLLFYHHGALRKMPHDGFVYRKAEKIIGVSRNLVEKLADFRPRYAKKIIPIHNLTDGEWVRRQAGAFVPDLAPGTFHIVTCGRLHRDKGMDLAVEACALLERKYDLHWWIIGGGPEEGNLRRRIQGHGLERTVTLLGQRENPYPYMAACDLYVQPSRVEGYPMSILEAWILGKPVLSTDNPGGREVLEDGKYGMLCPISAPAIANGVEEYLLRPTEFPAFDETRKSKEILERLEEIL